MEEQKKEKEDEAEEAAAVAELVRKEVADWDDEVKTRARFKALSGQRSDWEPLYLFWRNLIVKIAHRLGVFIIRPSRVSSLWFCRPGGLTPLCLDRVLVEMHRAGDLLPLPNSYSTSYSSFRFSNLFRKALGILISSADNDTLAGDCYILAPLLEEKAHQVVDVLSESHWTPSCVLTMKKFQDICGGSKEALAILSYLAERGRGRQLILNGTDPIEGVKVCLAPGAASTASNMDYSILHLTWTMEKLEKQLNLMDQRYQKTRNSALSSVKSGNKRVAMRFVKEMKLISLSRERSNALLDRVENVLGVIADAESSKKVSEAIQSSTHAIKENMVNIEEVELCLQEVDENIDSLKRIDDALASTPAYAEMDDEDIEDEFDELELEIKSEMGQVLGKSEIGSSAGVDEISETADMLNKALSNLNLKDGTAKPVRDKSISEEGILEAA